MKKYEASKFHFFIKQEQTRSMKHTIRVVSMNIKKGKEIFNEVKISFKIELSIKLHPDEFIEEEKLLFSFQSI